MKTTPMWEIRLFMAGDIHQASSVIARFVTEHGWCVTVTPTTYIYSGGQEAGFVVSAIAYARFAEPIDRSRDMMNRLATALMHDLGQKSYSVCTPTESTYFTRDVPTARHADGEKE